jgi:hypothetical protein
MNKIGFWQGIGMAWTSLITAIVMALRATESTASAALNVAQSGEEATKVLKANVVSWSANDEQMKKLNLVA